MTPTPEQERAREGAGYTPGPWLWQRDTDDGGYVVWTRQPHTGELAHILPGDINGSWPSKANARLIAAAPELLEALILLEAEMVLSGNAGSEDYGWKPAIEKTRTAIRKARGE